jgi:biopolymer transport protein ExbD
VAARVADEEAKLELDLPDVSEALPASFQPNELIISVDADGKYFIEGAFRQTEQVEQLMRRSFANNPLTQAVIIRADRRTDWEHVALLLDLCKKIGFHQYSATFDDE